MGKGLKMPNLMSLKSGMVELSLTTQYPADYFWPYGIVPCQDRGSFFDRSLLVVLCANEQVCTGFSRYRGAP
jgi:hypothetical protein